MHIKINLCESYNDRIAKTTTLVAMDSSTLWLLCVLVVTRLFPGTFGQTLQRNFDWHKIGWFQ